MRYCKTCGAKLSEGARFCTSCGARVGEGPTGGAAPAGSDGAPGRVEPERAAGWAGSPSTSSASARKGDTEAPADGGRPAGLGVRILQFRRTALAAVPAWAVALLALLLAAGTAYAAYRVVMDLVLPALEQAEDAEEVEEVEKVEETVLSDEEEEIEEEAEPTEEELALAAYEEVLEQYLAVYGSDDPYGFDYAEDSDTTAFSDAWTDYGQYEGYAYVLAPGMWEYCTIGSFEVRYCYWDIDGDGVSELLVGAQNPYGGWIYGEGEIQVCGIYSFDGEQVICVMCGLNRQCIWVCEDGTIGYGNSGSWASGQYYYYSFADAEATLIEALDYDYEELGWHSGEYAFSITYSVDGSLVEELTVDSQDEQTERVSEIFAEMSEGHVRATIVSWQILVQGD